VSATTTGRAVDQAPMRERIVEVAEELFAERGYGGTSLRHIAERLDVSKAAVYYHFRTKADIAKVVVGRALDALTEVVDRLLIAGTDVTAWERALPQIIDVVLAHRRALFVFERDENTYAALFAGDPGFESRFEDQRVRVSAVLARPDVDAATRVRLGCVIGALLMPLTMLSHFYQDVPVDDMRAHLQAAATALLGGARAG
jgi:AcrR family transcriptional regulator